MVKDDASKGATMSRSKSTVLAMVSIAVLLPAFLYCRFFLSPEWAIPVSIFLLSAWLLAYLWYCVGFFFGISVAAVCSATMVLSVYVNFYVSLIAGVAAIYVADRTQFMKRVGAASKQDGADPS
jgi:hypothetical protein